MLNIDVFKPIFKGTAGRPIWSFELDPMSEGGPYNITVSSQGCTLTLQDVLFGDVWLCSGQSNMEFPLHMACLSIHVINS